MNIHNNPGKVVDLFAPPLLEDEINRYKNKTATDIILPRALSAVVDWGCRKGPTQTLKEFLMEKHPGNEWKKYSKRWTESDLKKLDEIDCSKLDTSIMFKLIQEEFDASAYGVMEKVLREAKEIRNEDSHSPDGAAISPTTLTEVRDIARRILEQGAKIFSVETQILQKKIEEIKELVDQINEAAKTVKEKSVDKLEELFSTDGRRETEKIVIEQESDTLPFSEVKVFRRDIFHPCKLLVECKVKEVVADEEAEEVCQELSDQVLLCENLLTHQRDANIIISGHPGSGKSTVLKRLREDFVSKSSKIFHGLQNFKLLLYMECRDSVETISQLLERNFPMTFGKIADEEDVVEALAQSKMLICVDGIDESNANSSILWKSLIDQFGSHGRSSFIFTSRPGSTEVLNQELTDKGLPYFTVSIQPVDDESEQIDFLGRFQMNVPEINAPELIDTFTGLDPLCKECLVQPVYLSLFCHLYKLSPQAVKEWKNELDVMRHIWRISIESVRKRLTLEQVEGDENIILSSKLLGDICNLTVLLLLENKLVIDQSTYEKLCGRAFGDREVSYHKILSCILVSGSDRKSFTYLHKSHAEFLAANAILTRLDKEPDALFMTSVIRIAKDYTASQRNINRSATSDSSSPSPSDRTTASYEAIAYGKTTLFSNVFRFVLLLFVERGDIEVIQRIFQESSPMLVREKIPLSYFIELALSCRSSERVIEAAAEASRSANCSETVIEAAAKSSKKANCSDTAIEAAAEAAKRARCSETVIEAAAEAATRARFFVSSARHMAGAALMLRYHQPEVLTVSRARTQEPIPELEELMKTVVEYHTGRLRLVLPYSFYESSCDDYILKLMTTSQ